MLTREKVILALDHPTLDEALACARLCANYVYGFKLERLLLCREGPREAIRAVKEIGGHVVFADAKIHTIPDTAAAMVVKLAGYGADIISAHASGGEAMLTACVSAYASIPLTKTGGIVPITLLTSIGADECYRIYLRDRPRNVVLQFAQLADQVGAYGVVCSGEELLDLKDRFLGQKRLVTGLRSPGEPSRDQIRVATPAQALTKGADLLIIGRQITTKGDPRSAMTALNDQLEQALSTPG